MREEIEPNMPYALLSVRKAVEVLTVFPLVNWHDVT